MTAPAHDADARRPAGSGAVWGALVTVYLVWGSTYLGIALVVESMPPLLGMGLRFLVAGTLAAALVVVVRGRSALRIERAELGGAAFVGLMLLGFGIGVLALAERYVPTGVAALIVAVVPLWIALLRAVTGDRPPPLTLVGVAIGLGGVAILVRPTGGPDVVDSRTAWWSLVIVGSSACWAIGSFLMPRIPTPRDALVLTTYEMLAGGLILSLAGLLGGERFSSFSDATPRSWLGLVYLVVVGSIVGYTAYLWLLDNAPISLVSTYAYVNPVVAVLLGVLVLGESLTAPMLLGGAVVLLGVGLVVAAERRGG